MLPAVDNRRRKEEKLQSLLDKLTEWFKNMLIDGIMGNLTGIFTDMNEKIGDIAGQVGMSPADFEPGIFSMIQNISENVIMPIAGIILTFIACYELIQLVIAHNNLANFETWIFYKWVFKTFVAVTLITNTTNITMAVFDVAGHVINQSGGIISNGTAVSADQIYSLRATLEATDLGPLIGIFVQSLILPLFFKIITIIIFVIVYARMIEIYLMVSMAPIPFATFGNREESMMGKNYLRSLFALGFQGFLIMICVGIYAVLIQNITFTDDVMGAIWKCFGYAILLAITLFKTGSISKSVLHAH